MVFNTTFKNISVMLCRGFKVGRYFYPSEIVYCTGRNYRSPPKLAVVKTTSTIGLWNIFHKKLMITSIAEFLHSNRTTAFSHDQVDGIFPVLKITLP